MVKPVLGKSVRSDWFFLGRDFAVRHGNGPSRLFLFWSKAGKFKICDQNSEKEMWILSFFMKLPEKAKKIETLLRFQRWMKKTNILWARFNSMQKLKQLSPKARRPNTILSTNRKVQTQTRRRLLIWTLLSATLKLMVWKMGKLKAYLRPSLTIFLSKFVWTHGWKTEKNNWTGDSFQFSAQYKLTAILDKDISI